VRGDELVRPSTPTANTRSQLQISDPNLKLQISNPMFGPDTPTRDHRHTDTDTETHTPQIQWCMALRRAYTALCGARVSV
jgi:hypothetical protein